MAISPHLAVLLSRDHLALSPEELQARDLARLLSEEVHEAQIRLRPPIVKREPVRIRLGTALIAVGERLATPKPACP